MGSASEAMQARVLATLTAANGGIAKKPPDMPQGSWTGTITTLRKKGHNIVPVRGESGKWMGYRLVEPAEDASAPAAEEPIADPEPVAEAPTAESGQDWSGEESATEEPTQPDEASDGVSEAGGHHVFSFRLEGAFTPLDPEMAFMTEAVAYLSERDLEERRRVLDYLSTRFYNIRVDDARRVRQLPSDEISEA